MIFYSISNPKTMWLIFFVVKNQDENGWIKHPHTQVTKFEIAGSESEQLHMQSSKICISVPN